MKSFKHSGAFGDLIYSLPIVKHFGGGDFYLHLDQINWIGQHYYGNKPDAFHQGRMTQSDFDYMKTFMESQTYINSFSVLDPKTTEITHNLDRFRTLFVGHPTHYLDVYNQTFGITGDSRKQINTEPWLTVPKADHKYECIVNRTARWSSDDSIANWNVIREQFQGNAGFVGLPNEHQAFIKATGWNLPYVETPTMLDLAQVIAGAIRFAGNQSQCYALAVGLGVPHIYLELRRDLPKERNECYFPDRTEISYF